MLFPSYLCPRRNPRVEIQPKDNKEKEKKMNNYDATKILGISGEINPTIVKKAYRAASFKYHPDRNPAGEEMMKAVNEAFETLENFEGNLEHEQAEYGEALNTALSAIWGLEGLNLELCGAWLWVDGETKEHKTALKEAGFKWASKKKKWFFRPEGFKSRSRGNLSMDDIRTKYGTQQPNR